MTRSLPTRGTSMPELLEWFENQWPFGDRHPVRVETYTEQGELVVRCELPGMDPEQDIHLNVEGDHLTITAERTREERTDRHSEFQYGSFTRTLLLPTGADPDGINADYDAGILTIRIPHRETRASKEIPVARSRR